MKEKILQFRNNYQGEGVDIRRKLKVQKTKPEYAVTTFVILLILVFAAFIFIMRYITGSSALTASATYQNDKILLTLNMEKTRYNLGEPITFKLSLKNITPRILRLDFRNDLQVDFAVQQENNWIFFKTIQDIWRYSNKIVIKREHVILSLAPQETKVYTCVWDQKDYKGNMVDPGKYIITGVFNAIGERKELQMRGKTE